MVFSSKIRKLCRSHSGCVQQINGYLPEAPLKLELAVSVFHQIERIKNWKHNH
jgi:hypothetical protein